MTFNYQFDGGDVAVVMVPLPAQGHLNQLLHLSRRLLGSHLNLTVYYTGTATHLRQAGTRVHGWDPRSATNFHFHEFPTPPFESPKPDPKTRWPSHLLPAFNASLLLREPLRDFLSQISTEFRRVVVICDSLMAWNVQDVVSIPNAESYAFVSVSAFSTFSFLWGMIGKPPLPEEARVLEHLPDPGCCVCPGFIEFNEIQYKKLNLTSGIIFNSSRAIEGAFLDLMAQYPMSGTDKQWAVGPFNPLVVPGNLNPDSRARHSCLDWLDKQEKNSVVFVSFGSTTAMTEEQIREIAAGLADSGQRFLWALREADKGDVFTQDSLGLKLPNGFEEGKGLIVRDWAPQLEILAHPSTGGFMSHCGWNSCMEAITMGVPMATWPVHSDQPANALLVTKLLKTGVEVDDGSRNEVVGSSRIANAVRRLMGSEEVDEMRKNAQELSKRVRESLKEGGDSWREMDSFISHIIRAY